MANLSYVKHQNFTKPKFLNKFLIKSRNIIFVAAAFLAVTNSSSYAKTQGSYVDLNIIRTDISAIKTNYQLTDPATTTIGSADNSEYDSFRDDDKVSYGLAYKYAFNFDNGLFVAPSLFFDYSNVSASADTSTYYKKSLKHRGGVKANIGYDITDKLSFFVNGGYAYNRYKVATYYDGEIYKGSGYDFAPSYGFGAKYSITDNLDLNLEYELSKITMEDPEIYKNSLTIISETELDLRVLRFGVSYKF